MSLLVVLPAYKVIVLHVILVLPVHQHLSVFLQQVVIIIVHHLPLLINVLQVILSYNKQSLVYKLMDYIDFLFISKFLVQVVVVVQVFYMLE